MARGLSDLQQAILRLAHEQYQELDEHQRARWVHLCTAQVMKDVYGFEADRIHNRSHNFRLPPDYPGDLAQEYNQRKNAAKAAISRSFKRLEGRGLVIRFANGIQITAAGIEAAASCGPGTETLTDTIG